MTKDEKIETVKKKLMDDDAFPDSSFRRLAERIVGALDDEPADDIPIGHPCEFQHPDNNHQLAYSKEDGRLTARKELATISYGGFPAKDKRPLTVWDIDEKYGGPPEWVIARAYNDTTNYWLENEQDIRAYSGLHTSLFIERRPEGN